MRGSPMDPDPHFLGSEAQNYTKQMGRSVSLNEEFT